MLDKTRKLMIGENEYTFKMTNRTILKIDAKYGNYGTVLQGIMEGKEFTTNALKLLSCCCLEKEFGYEELTDLLTPRQLNNGEIATFVTNLYFDYIGINDTKDNKETKKSKTEKN
ncbi:RNA polymerase subunit sigma [Clostridium beijerinckii]|uniref:RNA polymerase subunit sigma n=1 Tax=Clostridium beijerinckii TaxID=1520 RepID=UPI0022261212|nr:RNA polymerase subunit sigma [Clostridium beijerinckii]UYZ35416.1 RNA polymerase subunit sigma [Clostridium beijerinckii]